MVRTSSKPAARCRPRRRAGGGSAPGPTPPGEGGADAGTKFPTRAVAGAIREKGPAHVQGRRRAPRRSPPAGPAAGAGRRTPPRRLADATGAPRPFPPRGGGRFRRDGGAGSARDGPATDPQSGNERGRRGTAAPPAAAGPSPASRLSPTGPALRANPYPEVTDLTCRLPLHALIQHARGCSPWRPAADMGTARRETYTFSPGFSRADESSPDAAGTAALSRAWAPISGRTHSRAPGPSQRKENSSRGPRQLLRVRLRYRTGRLAAPVSATPGSGIWTRFPFDRHGGDGGHRPPLPNGLRLSLRTD
ncbi:hypothetical protein ROHU_037140 [Labeo rohita]|uniref:Uncharacterized protein n=1 Tax=Labeo rohita TaxID=84645 RepID=A0A498M728_LABRO|nr:hypothetical protein ROHU_037140 [Labeo rohita]